jgi:hypothetical protein
VSNLCAILAPAAIGALMLGMGCASITYERRKVFVPVAPSAVENLKLGETDLEEVLARLGAPIYVWEGGFGEIVLAYGAEREGSWSFRIWLPAAKELTGPLRYDDAATKLDGYLLVFDTNLKLKFLREGLLRNFRVITARRPERVDAALETTPP